MYRLDNSFLQHHFAVTVVGCGGTGGHVAEGLCRVLPDYAALVLVDHDLVEERNLIRQNFTREELGCFKSEALARRLAQRYGRPVGYALLPVNLVEFLSPGLVIGCVDNGLARGDIAKRMQTRPIFGCWWVDAGNGVNYGQVVIGNRTVNNLNRPFEPRTGICHALPLPTIQRPELLQQVPRGRNCVDVDLEQGPTINQAMAALVVEVVRRLIEGFCPWMQLYLDLEAGTLVPVIATPEVVAQATDIKKKYLLR